LEIDFAVEKILDKFFWYCYNCIRNYQNKFEKIFICVNVKWQPKNGDFSAIYILLKYWKFLDNIFKLSVEVKPVDWLRLEN